MALCLLSTKHVKHVSEVAAMKALDYVINLMGHSDEEGEAGYHENFSLVLLTGFLAMMVLMVVI
jgi:hypothetical protein